jgi:hypothetical protein
MPRKTKRAGPTTFIVSTTDGERFDEAAMRVWLETHAPGSTLERANKTNAIRAWAHAGCGGPRAWVITVIDRDHAFWWKIRWGEDLAIHRRVAKEIDDAFSMAAVFIREEEDARILQSLGAQAKNVMLDTADKTSVARIEQILGLAS